MRQNMGKLTLSETYMVLFYYTAGKHTDIYLPQNSAGIVLGGIYGLLQSGCVEKEKNGRLAVYKPLSSEYTSLEEMYTNIKQHSKNTTKWLDYYCCSPSQKNIKLLVDDLQEALVQRQMIKVQVKKGIFRNTFSISALYRFQRLVIFPLIVFKEKLPILFDKSFDNRKFIHFEFLIFGRMGIIESPLFKGDISADKI